MKRSYLLALVVSVMLPALAVAETFDGNLNLSSQMEVDAAAGYTVVTGSLTISGANISDLSSLSDLQMVGSYIAINGNPSLTTVVDGFPSLTDVDGGIFVYYNDNLTVISGFDALLQTGDNIDFWYNDSLVSVTGFGSLQTAGWSLEFGGHPLLVEIPDFSSLQTISSSLFILDNPSLSKITGFQALQYVDWSFQIGGNNSLDSVCGFFNYFSVNNPYSGGGAFDIVNNGPLLPNPMTEQDVVDAGSCAVIALEELRSLVVSLDLPKGIEKRLTGYIDEALLALECCVVCGASAAVAELDAFKVDVERQRNKKLSGMEVDQLNTEADEIIALLMP